MSNSKPVGASTAISAPASVGRSRKSIGAIVAIAVIAVISAAAGAVTWARAHSGTDDAFELTRPQATYTGFQVTQKSPDFFIGVDLTHPGTRIEVVHVDAHTGPNVDFLGAVTVWPRQIKSVSVGAGLGFPPTDVRGTHALIDPIPSAETLFEPKGFGAPGPVTVVAGFRLRSGEIGAVNGIRVVYKVDGKRMTKDSPQAGIACLKPKCGGGPNGSDNPNFDTRVLSEAGLLPKD